jgi:mono/diheme cytochrome c family protein
VKPFWIVICTIGFLAISLFAVALSGTYNISAKAHHWALTSYLLETFRDHSISRHSAELKLPPMDQPELALKGALHFDETCWKCHGAPGRNPEEFALGLYPEAPPLESAATDLNLKEIFWTIDNGIKFTGMPAFGLSHKKEEILAMVAFIEKLPTLDAQRYGKVVADAKVQFGNEDHPHGEAPPSASTGGGPSK